MIVLLLLAILKCSNSNNLFALSSIPMKGLGLIALKDILQGQLLLEESPVLALKQTRMGFSEDYQYERIRKELSKLSITQENSFFSLHSRNSNHLPYNEVRALDIFRSNAYPLRNVLSEPSDNSNGVFLNISRINSACNPNVHYSYQRATKRGRVYSIRNIKKGEEILNNYVGTLLESTERKDYLKLHFGFDCNCDVCCSNQLKECDAIRSKLFALTERAKHLLTEKKYSEVLIDLKERMHLLSADPFLRGSPPLLFQCAWDGILASRELEVATDGTDSSSSSSSSSSRTRTLFSEWKEIALKSAIICKGRDSEEVKAVNNIMNTTG